MLSDKKLARIEKLLGKDALTILESASPESLDVTIAHACASIKEAADQLEANPKYQELKESLKACSAGLREVKAFQNAKIQYALHLAEEKGRQ